jgi:hypothetical protein
MLKATSDRVGDDMRDGVSVLTIVNKIERYARGPRDRQTLMGDPLGLSEDRW